MLRLIGLELIIGYAPIASLAIGECTICEENRRIKVALLVTDFGIIPHLHESSTAFHLS